MTIMLPPQVETRLRRKAARSGQDADVLAGAILAEALSVEETPEELREELREDLPEEYHQLVAVELRDELTDVQVLRLHQVTPQLDDLDRHSPAAQIMAQNLEEAGHKLDEMLTILRSLPLADRTP